MVDHTNSMEKVERKCDCWYGARHKFDQWKIKEDREISRTGEKINQIVGRWLVQERKCQKCGFVELNKQEINLN